MGGAIHTRLHDVDFNFKVIVSLLLQQNLNVPHSVILHYKIERWAPSIQHQSSSDLVFSGAHTDSACLLFAAAARGILPLPSDSSASFIFVFYL
jgi:hypothetical protein